MPWKNNHLLTSDPKDHDDRNRTLINYCFSSNLSNCINNYDNCAALTVKLMMNHLINK